MIVQDIIDILEERFPLHLQESWDNCGLQVGDRQSVVKNILTALDVTDEVIEEAIEKGANLIVTHHPMLFKPIKRIDESTKEGARIRKLIRHDISVYSAHTNLDVGHGGLNDYGAEAIGLTSIRCFVESGRETYYKVYVFVPSSHGEEVRLAMAEAGAGQIGDYKGCSFTTKGEGRFEPLVGANPYVGTIGSLETVDEEKIEVIVHEKALDSVLKNMLEAHPYEEVAYDIVELKNNIHVHSIGRLGEFEEPIALEEFAKRVEHAFTLKEGLKNIRYGGAKHERVQRVAICTGSGAEFIKNAAKLKVDAYITGDVKYHEMQLAKDLGILIVDASHFGTEHVVTHILKSLLEKEIGEAFAQSLDETIEKDDDHTTKSDSDIMIKKNRTNEILVFESELQDDFFFKI